VTPGIYQYAGPLNPWLELVDHYSVGGGRAHNARWTALLLGHG
jgi:hypothetical protein